MVYATLSVVQYRSPAGGCGHWAFNLVITDDDNKENYILQIENSSGEFKFEELENVDPESSTRYIRSVPISDSIDGQAAIDHVREILREQPIRREPQWSCQDWIIEAVALLNEEGEISDYEAGEAKDILEEDYRSF